VCGNKKYIFWCLLFLIACEANALDNKVLWLGSCTGTVNAKYREVFTGSGYDIIQLKKDEGSVLAKGEVWGVVNPDLLHIKEQKMSLDEKNLKYDIFEFEESFEQKKSEFLNTVQDIKISMQKIEYLKSAENDVDILKKINKTLSAKKAEIESINKKLEFLYSDERKLQKIDKIKLDFQRKKHDFNVERSRSLLKASDAGVLKYFVEPKALGDDGRINTEPSKTFAIIKDDTELTILVDSKELSYSLNGASNYRVVVKSRSGARTTASYLDEVTITNGENDLQFTRFRINGADNAVFTNLIGEKVYLVISQHFSDDENVKFISKSSLLDSNADLVKLSGWKIAALKAYPNFLVAGVGESKIALLPK